MAPSTMKSAAMNKQTMTDNRSTIGRSPGVARDASGYEIFSEGDTGAAHVLAHRMADTSQYELGRCLLGQWLASHTGSGSQWVHLQFHMALFELATGHWASAHRRYLEHVSPTLDNPEDAMTDAPALLWRLALSAPDGTRLDWEPLHRIALSGLQRPSDPFTEAHNLLALAGARDIDGLDAYIRSHSADSCRTHLVCRLAAGLFAYLEGHYHRAAELLSSLAPRIAEIGGSRAQVQLFDQLATAMWRKTAASDPLLPQLRAA
jgi:hypothetical protein